MQQTIGGISMHLPLILGAGVAKAPPHLVPYLRRDVSVGAVVTGSYTLKQRDGNQGTLSWPNDWTDFIEAGFGLNSFGMPNSGFVPALQQLDNLAKLQPRIISVAGFSVEEYIALVGLANQSPYVSGIELNLGCPNTGGLPFAYDLEATGALLKGLRQHGRQLKPIWVKLSPYVTSEELALMASNHPDIDFSEVPTISGRFLQYMLLVMDLCDDVVSAVVFSNTLPNCRKFGTDDKPVTTPFDGKAGLSGPILKPIAIKLVRQARSSLSSSIDVIGCGGILTGDDAVDYFEAGARAVQCTSGPAWHSNGPRFFNDLVVESERLQQYLMGQRYIRNGN